MLRVKLFEEKRIYEKEKKVSCNYIIQLNQYGLVNRIHFLIWKNAPLKVSDYFKLIHFLT